MCVYMRYKILAADHLRHTKLGVHATSDGSGPCEAIGARCDTKTADRVTCLVFSPYAIACARVRGGALEVC